MNQYPPTFYDPIIRETLESIIRSGVVKKTEKPEEQSSTKTKKASLKIQYRGKVTEDYARALHKAGAPCNIVMTLRKLKTVMPSLKSPTEKMLKSGVVYKLTCPSCSACYVGETTRHLQTRVKEHIKKKGPMKTHLGRCDTTLVDDNVEILQASARGEGFLLTLEALYIKEVKPTINTKEEWKSRELKIKL